jgi:hypothetical protein
VHESIDIISMFLLALLPLWLSAAEVLPAVAGIPGTVGIVAVACFPTFATTVPDLAVAGVPVVVSSLLLLVL